MLRPENGLFSTESGCVVDEIRMLRMHALENKKCVLMWTEHVYLRRSIVVPLTKDDGRLHSVALELP